MSALKLGLGVGRGARPPAEAVDLTIAHDTFTAADGTLLTAHAPEVGAAWVINTDPAATGLGVINGGKVKTTAVNNLAVVLVDQLLTDADCDVWCDVVVVTDNNNDQIGVAARSSKTVRTYYRALLTMSNNTVSLRRANGGTNTTLASVAWTPTVGTFRLLLRCAGDLIKVFIDGVEQISVTDVAPLAGPGYVGISESVVTSHAEGCSITEFGASYL